MLVVVSDNSFCKGLEDFFRSHEDYSIWHSFEWIDFRLKTGKIEGFVTFMVSSEGMPVAGGIIQIIKKRRIFKYGYIQAGFLMNACDPAVIPTIENVIKECSATHGLFYVEADSNTDMTKACRLPYLVKTDGIIPSIPQHSLRINLLNTEDEILEGMKQKGRYNIRLSAKRGVIVRETVFDEDIKKFYMLLLETTERDGFRPNSYGYYEKLIKSVSGVSFMVAEHEGEILAGAIFSYFGPQALYYYGASSNVKRNLMAPYLLQWHGMLEGIKRGCKYYDFMGIANPANKNDRLSGVSDFKLKFGGEQIVYSLPWHLVFKPFRYFIYQFLKRKS